MTISSIVNTKKSLPKTLKFMGIVKNEKLTILVDSSSTHNYVDTYIIKELNVCVYPTRDLIFKVVERQHHNAKGICLKISIQIQGLQLQSGFYVLPLYGMDVLLGV